MQEMRIRRPPTKQEIAARADEIHQQHGGREDRAMDDWLQAEAELGAAESAAETVDGRWTRRRTVGSSRGDGRRTAVPKSRARRLI
jgi:hypothetical protein